MCISREVDIPETPTSRKYGKFVSKLVEFEINGAKQGIDHYIIDTFHLFAQTQKEIDINVESIMDKMLLNNILVNPERSTWKPDDSGFIRRVQNDETNFRMLILEEKNFLTRSVF